MCIYTLKYNIDDAEQGTVSNIIVTRDVTVIFTLQCLLYSSSAHYIVPWSVGYAE